MEDVKVKTRTGAFCESKRMESWNKLKQLFAVTLISAAIILSVTMMEWMDYRRVTLDTSILVDKSRGEKLTVAVNITFPRVPCFRRFTSLRQSPNVYIFLSRQRGYYGHQWGCAEGSLT